MEPRDYQNPFRPGAGQPPPYLAGRESETEEFERLLKQTTILENLVLTGLRGVGKTVLLDERFRALALKAGWLWAGTDLSESASVSEEAIATRLLTDLAPITSMRLRTPETISKMGFGAQTETIQHPVGYESLDRIYKTTPGLPADKLKAVLERTWEGLKKTGTRGLVFAYDEAQTMTDRASKDQYPLSMMLDVFQSIQRKGIPFMLVLTGLPTLFSKLVESRTFAERMFHVVILDQLDREASRDAIVKPITDYPIQLDDDSVELVINRSDGYPYFIQFICREIYDSLITRTNDDSPLTVPVDAIVRKLDADFFAGRWARASDRQRDLLTVIASLDSCDEEFTVHEIVERSKELLERPFSPSHVNQILVALAARGLVFKNRHGKYSFAVPLLGQFIRRQGA